MLPDAQVVLTNNYGVIILQQAVVISTVKIKGMQQLYSVFDAIVYSSQNEWSKFVGFQKEFALHQITALV